jgi:hypothetical protein
MHEAYRNFVRAGVEAAIAAARAATGFSHVGLRGEVREVLVRDLFRPLLPADIGVGTGEIISYTNQTSSQTDIILFDKRILPPVLFEDRLGLFPIESVLYAVEVKSKLTATELRSADSAAAKLKEFVYAPGYYEPSGVPRPHKFIHAVPALIALDSDLHPSGMSEIERYDSQREGGEPHIRSICVVGRGYWYWFAGGWKTWPSGYTFSEVVSFIGGVMNTYREIAASRGEPRMGRLLIDD